jgi:hypothetical protein
MKFVFERLGSTGKRRSVPGCGTAPLIRSLLSAEKSGHLQEGALLADDVLSQSFRLLQLPVDVGENAAGGGSDGPDCRNYHYRDQHQD